MSERGCASQSVGAPTDGCVLCSDGGEGNGEESKASRAACGNGGPPCVCCEEDLGWENETAIETWNGTEGDPWAGRHIDHCDLADLVSSQGTCCAGLGRQQCG